MSTYKVIQDIEAEDKLLGPLTLRQFIYAAIVVVMGFIVFKLAAAKWFLALPFLPPILFFGMLAAPFGHDQSNEVWLLAKIRFALKPRRRIWDQSGPKELVTITAPKRVEKHLTNGLDPSEVRSRLSALANTIDSRGWAVKNVDINLFSQPSYVLGTADTDRLIDPSTIPEETPDYDTSGFNDMLDDRNPTAQLLDQMMSSSAQLHRKEVVQHLQQGNVTAQQTSAQPTNYWFMHQAEPRLSSAGARADDQSAPIGRHPLSADDADASTQLRIKHANEELEYQHMKIIQPLSAQPNNTQIGAGQPTNGHAIKTVPPASPTVPPAANPVIQNLASSNDLSVATIARQAKKAAESPDDEVVVSLR